MINLENITWREVIRTVCKKRKYSNAYRDYWLEHPKCEVYGFPTLEPPHHIKTRGAGGKDNPGNLITLCHYHHVEVHKIGRRSFATRYGLEDRFFL